MKKGLIKLITARKSDDGWAETRAALQAIFDERARQITAEGFDRGHDDEHDSGALALAGGCYAMRSIGLKYYDSDETEAPPIAWPWSKADWKPKGPTRDLVRAAALIVAELERLERARNREN